jgi:ABC-type phosphate transport system substrate-binding protein
MPFLKVPGFPRLAMLLALAGNIAAAEVVTVVSPQNPTTTLSRSEVSNIFLGKINRFPNGQPAVPIDQPESSQPREEFYRDISNKQPADIKAYWSRMIFTGRGQPPMVVEGDEQVKKTLADRPDGIGYIDRAAVDDTVKVLAVQ